MGLWSYMKLPSLKLFVANLDWSLTGQELQAFFAPLKVTGCQIILDRETSRSKGFGFVEFASEQDATDAMALNGRMLLGRPIDIKPALPRKEGGGRPPREPKRSYQPPTRDGNRREYIPEPRRPRSREAY